MATPPMGVGPPLTDPNNALSNERENAYPLRFWYIIFGIIGFLTLIRLATLLKTQWDIWRWRRASQLYRSSTNFTYWETQHDGQSVRVTDALKRIPVVLLSIGRILAFRIPLPIGWGHYVSLTEFLSPFVYLAVLLTWEFINTRNIVTGRNLYVGYWGNRAGVLAASQLPFVVALAGKNNIISTLTGIGYEKLNPFHRGSARAVTLLVWIHLWGRWKLGLTGEHSLQHGWVRVGITAATALTTIVLIGNRYVRMKAYELFFLLHNWLVIISLVCAYFHTKKHHYGHLVWPALLLWALDRAFRLIRVVCAVIQQKRSRSPVPTVVNVLSPDTLRVTLTFRRSHLLHWQPGQSAFLCIPSVSTIYHPMEFHPFTIANVPQGGSFSESEVEREIEDEEVQMKFIIRARDGFTKRLFQFAWDAAVDVGRGKDPRKVAAYVDGPYGSPPDVGGYHSVVLIAGGSGVAFSLPILIDIARRSGRMKALTRRVSFIWAVRDIEHLEWISDELRNCLANKPPHLEIDVSLFVTGNRRLYPSVTNPSMQFTESRKSYSSKRQSESAEKQSVAVDVLPVHAIERRRTDNGTLGTTISVPSVMVCPGRPSMDEILEDETARVFDGSLLVCVSGPHSMANAVRRALRNPSLVGPSATLRTGVDVTLHVEGFCFA